MASHMVHPGSIAAQFRRSPKYIARLVTKDWRAEHPQWTDDDALSAYEFLLEVYQQTRVWWLKHPKASNAELGVTYHAIIKAFLRGDQLLSAAGKKVRPLRGKDLRARQNALWNCNSFAENANLELDGWIYRQAAMGRRPTKSQEDAMYDRLVRRHTSQPRTSHPVRAEILGHF